MVPMAYTCLLVSEPFYIPWSNTHSPFKVLKDEMAAIDACHPAFAEHKRVTDRLDVIWYQVFVVFTIEEYVGEYAEAVLDPTRSAVLSTSSPWVAHEAAPVLGRRENLSTYEVLCGPGQGAKRTISLEDLEQ